MLAHSATTKVHVFVDCFGLLFVYLAVKSYVVYWCQRNPSVDSRDEQNTHAHRTYSYRRRFMVVVIIIIIIFKWDITVFNWQRLFAKWLGSWAPFASILHTNNTRAIIRFTLLCIHIQILRLLAWYFSCFSKVLHNTKYECFCCVLFCYVCFRFIEFKSCLFIRENS